MPALRSPRARRLGPQLLALLCPPPTGPPSSTEPAAAARRRRARLLPVQSPRARRSRARLLPVKSPRARRRRARLGSVERPTCYILEPGQRRYNALGQGRWTLEREITSTRHSYGTPARPALAQRLLYAASGVAVRRIAANGVAVAPSASNTAQLASTPAQNVGVLPRGSASAHWMAWCDVAGAVITPLFSRALKRLL